MFQYMARHSPLKVDDLLASISSSIEQENKPSDEEMVGWWRLLMIVIGVFFFLVSFCLLRDHSVASFSQKLRSLVFEYGLPPGSIEKILKILLWNSKWPKLQDLEKTLVIFLTRGNFDSLIFHRRVSSDFFTRGNPNSRCSGQFIYLYLYVSLLFQQCTKTDCFQHKFQQIIYFNIYFL